MPTYIEILADHEPFPFGVDDNNRVMWSIDIRARVPYVATATWEEDIEKILSDAGLLVISGAGANSYIGPEATIPAGPGPFIQILDTGGESPMETHDGAKYHMLSAQIVVRADGYLTGRTRAQAIWRELDGVRNITVTA